MRRIIFCQTSGKKNHKDNEVIAWGEKQKEMCERNFLLVKMLIISQQRCIQVHFKCDFNKQYIQFTPEFYGQAKWVVLMLSVYKRDTVCSAVPFGRISQITVAETLCFHSLSFLAS